MIQGGRASVTPPLDTSGVRALVLEALDKIASPTIRDRIVFLALAADQRDALPSDPVPLSAFVTGPLCEATNVELGTEGADALLQDLGPLLRLAAARASEAVAPQKRQSRTLRPPPMPLPESGVRVREGGAVSGQPVRHLTAPYVAAWSTEAPANLILIVDDDTHFLRGLARLLRLEGYDVIDAGTPRAALMLCERLHPELVITDFDMPDMNGAELTGAILEQMKIAAPKVVMLTGAAHPPTQVPGITKVVRKDIRPVDLVALIDAVLES
ncbi:MAG: response regulator [Deltaproteobacteria bacterium]|nr:response regulator [Deltaproteobacteria bacterium]